MPIDVEPLAKMLHTDEYQYLKNNNFNQAAFYSLWTKKEAFLKAIGIGFIDGYWWEQKSLQTKLNK